MSELKVDKDRSDSTPSSDAGVNDLEPPTVGERARRILDDELAQANTDVAVKRAEARFAILKWLDERRWWKTFLTSGITLVQAVALAVTGWLINTALDAQKAAHEAYAGINFQQGVVDFSGHMVFAELPEKPYFSELRRGQWRGMMIPVKFKDEAARRKAVGRPFSAAPGVFVSLKSIDCTQSHADQAPKRNCQLRMSIAAPEGEVTRDGFQLWVFTWGPDDPPTWIEVSWYAFAQPEVKR